MGIINYGIIGRTCKDCLVSEDQDSKVYARQAINEILNEALELVCRQHEGNVICDCEANKAKRILEFIGNQCAFCNNTEALIFNEILPYIKKENPLKETPKEKEVFSSENGRKVIYPTSFKKK